jgi:hypothetical protein
MLVGKRDMDYITRDVDFRGRLIKYCEMVIDYGKWLQNGNFPHGMSGLRYYLKYINTIMYLKCDNEELFQASYDMAVLGDDLSMGRYQGHVKIQKLKKIVNDCVDLKNNCDLGSDQDDDRTKNV